MGISSLLFICLDSPSLNYVMQWVISKPFLDSTEIRQYNKLRLAVGNNDRRCKASNKILAWAIHSTWILEQPVDNCSSSD